MEHQQDNNDNNLMLAIVILLLNTLSQFNISQEIVINLQFVAVIVLILINLDKLYETSLKWYLKIKEFLNKITKKK